MEERKTLVDKYEKQIIKEFEDPRVGELALKGVLINFALEFEQALLRRYLEELKRRPLQ